MLFVEGTQVYYRDFVGVITFCTNQCVSILIKKGEHRSQDVNLIVYKEDFKHIRYVKEK